MRLLVRLALCGLPAALVFAAGASPGTAREAIAPPDQSVPVLVSPAPGQVFNAGAKFAFRVRTHPGDERLFLYVSRSSELAKACGLIGSDVFMYELKPTSDPSVYATDYFASWTSKPGTYFWQAYRVEYRDGADGCIESEVRSLVIKAAAPTPTPKPKPTPTPPKPKAPGALHRARLAGSFGTTVRIQSASGINTTPGDTLDLTWIFTPRCSTGPCATTVRFKFTHPSLDTHSARVALGRAGASYAGKSSATLTECSVEDVYGTMRVQLRVKKGAWIDGRWRATRVTGTMRFDAPPTSAALGSIHCPAGRFTATVVGNLAR